METPNQTKMNCSNSIEMNENVDIVKEDDYVIIQKQNYTKIHKVKKNIVTLGKDEVDISAIIGQPYWTTYKMEPKADSKRCYILKKTKCAISISDEIIKDITSGMDNREIVDDGSSQKLSTQEIINLKECGTSAQGIVSQLIENSKTFFNKTEYSQEKYLKKKEKKYFEYITIRKPSFRLVSEVLLRQPSKVLGLRMDTLAQLVYIAGIRSGGLCILYESGCLGLVAAAIIDKLGPDGTVIHVHSGASDHPTPAVLALNLPKEQLNRLISLDIQRLCISDKNDESVQNSEINNMNLNNSESDSNSLNPKGEVLGKRKSDFFQPVGGKMKRENHKIEAAIKILSERKADSLIIVGKEYPNNIFIKLIKYVAISRPFVVYCPIREPLQDLYCELKQRSDIIAVRLTESWLRDYQVLPDRTHPDIRINGSGGFLLSGFYVCS